MLKNITTPRTPRVFQKDSSKKPKEISMDDPVVSPYPFIYFTCDRDPTPTDPTYSGDGYPGLIYFWYNTVSTNLFCCTDCSTAGALVWQEIAMSANLLSILAEAGWTINTARSYVARSSPAFDTVYSPSLTNDTEVVAVINLTSDPSTPAEVDVQINSGAGFVTLCQEVLSDATATNRRSVHFTVPAGASYQLVNSSGTAFIVQVMELRQ